MSLPNPSMSFSPFAILTAEEMNDLVENIESLSDGTGFELGAIDTDTLAESAVTPVKRSGGFFIGIIPGSTLGSTGNKAITGVGFQPKMVRFTVLPSSSTSASIVGIGAMTASAQYLTGIAGQATESRNSSTSACIGWITAGAAAFTLLASYVSLDADGFTINVSNASSAFDVAFEAYA